MALITDTPSPQHSRRLRLRTTLVMPFVLQIVAAVGLVGYVSFWNGQKAVQSLANKLVEEIEDQVVQYLDNYTSVPHKINQVNLDAIDLGILNLEDFESMGRYFWRQLKVFDVGYINFGNEQEAFIGAERLDDGSLMIHEAPIADVNQFSSYTTDAEGNRLSSTVEPAFGTLDDEEWYAAAVEAETAVWSEIYQWEDQPEVLSISSSYPVYDANQVLLGVIGSDLILTQISTFLSNLDVEPAATIFIMEPSGLLVASSNDVPLYEVEGEEEVSRLSALDSPDVVISATADRLLQEFQSFQQIDAPQALNFALQGERQYVQAFPWQDQFGLDWVVVVTVPEAAFMGQIYANTRLTMLLCLAALGVAIAIGILTSRWITRPILRISEASDRLAQGDLDQHVLPSALIEVDTLANSFNKMSGQLKDSFTHLEQKNEALRIAEENFRSIFENALEGIFQSSPQGRFLSVNPALAQIYGYDSPQEMIEQVTDISKQLYVDPERRAEFRGLLEQQGFAKDFEYRCYRKDSSIIWTQIDARSVKDNNGNVLYYEGIVQDITERKRREDELKRQLEELQIEIDHKKREEEVKSLTSSTYFQEVQEEISDVNLDEFWS